MPVEGGEGASPSASDRYAQGERMLVERGATPRGMGKGQGGQGGSVTPRGGAAMGNTERELVGALDRGAAGGAGNASDDPNKIIEQRLVGMCDRLWDKVGQLEEQVSQLARETTRLGAKSSLESAHVKNSLDSMALDAAGYKDQLGDFSEWMERMALRQADAEKRLEDQLRSLEVKSDDQTNNARNTLGGAIARNQERLDLESKARQSIEAQIRDIEERLPRRGGAALAEDLEALEARMVANLEAQKLSAYETAEHAHETRRHMSQLASEAQKRDELQAQANLRFDDRLSQQQAQNELDQARLRSDLGAQKRELQQDLKDIDQRLTNELNNLKEKSADITAQLRSSIGAVDENVTKLRGETTLKTDSLSSRQSQLQDEYTQLQAANNNFNQQLSKLSSASREMERNVEDCRDRVTKIDNQQRRDLQEAEERLQVSLGQLREGLKRSGEEMHSLRDNNLAGLDLRLGQAFSHIAETNRRCGDLEAASQRHDEQFRIWGDEFTSRLDAEKASHAAFEQKEMKSHAAHDQRHDLHDRAATELRQYIEKVQAQCIDWGKKFDEKINEVRTGAKADLEANALQAFQSELKLWTKVIQMGQVPPGMILPQPAGAPPSVEPVWDATSQSWKAWDAFNQCWRTVPGRQ